MAARFGLSVGRFKEMRNDLEARGFPLPIIETAFVRRQTGAWCGGRCGHAGRSTTA
ncbi:MAG: hypothetical protein U1E43_08390 [Rhodospirillales bacterium]